MFLRNLISTTKLQLSLLRSLLTGNHSEVSNFCQRRIDMTTTTQTVPATIATNRPENVYQSRWGWHPISYDAFCKLKEIHKLIWNAWYAHKRFGRWLRKTTHQPPEQPPFDPRFTIERKGVGYYAYMMTHYRKNPGAEAHEEHHVSTTLYGKDTDYYFDPIASDVIETMRAARTPEENKEDVERTPLSEQDIHELFDKLFSLHRLDS
jgi:hypothetical protein